MAKDLIKLDVINPVIGLGPLPIYTFILREKGLNR